MNNPMEMAFQRYPDRKQQQLVARSRVLHPTGGYHKYIYFSYFKMQKTHGKTQFIYLVGLEVLSTSLVGVCKQRML